MIVVLGFSAVLLILGTAYIKSFTQTRGINEAHLSQLQVEMFVAGVKKIALLKFKDFAPHFYRAYKYQMARDRGDVLPNNYNPTPLEMFYGLGNNVLRNFNDPEFFHPLSVMEYSTKYSLQRANEYKRDMLYIEVTIKPKDNLPLMTYNASYEASRSVILSE